ncbi:MAG: flavoprotein [Sedimentisphaerales bacterium]|jgi:phosphopantothenoylcysteine decarboxylase/phosphopantothenate--cysteine ligase
MSGQSGKLDKVKVVLGVSGGIAAYKAIDLASKMTAAGAEVKTVLTENAMQLVGAKSFEAVTGGPVYTSMWETEGEYKIGHVNLADWADVVVVAPATANIIGKFANGICDDLLSTMLCACWAKPTILAPAMNEKMWTNPAVQKNTEVVRRMGVELIGPNRGRLACGADGLGRMAEPQEILEAAARIAAGLKRKAK